MAPPEVERGLLGNGGDDPLLALHRGRSVEEDELCDVTVGLLGGNHDNLGAAPRSPYQRLRVVGRRPHQSAEGDSCLVLGNSLSRVGVGLVALVLR